MIERLCDDCGKPIKPDAKTRNKHRCLCEKNQSPEQLEKLKDNSSGKHGGARDGAGRPKGSMNEDSKVRMEAKKRFLERVAKVSDRLFNAQFDLAIGEKYLMVKRTEGEGKNRKTYTEIVDDPDTIVAYLNGDLNNHGEDEYYFMTTKPADNRALDSLLNRAFGKPDEKLEITDPEGKGLFGGAGLTIKVVDARDNSQS